jgi:putative salt-induced outer membrane protein YdiY
MHGNTKALAIAVFCAALSGAAPASAQHTGPIAIAQHTEAVAAPPAVEDQMLVNIAAGATLNGGNTESYSANAGGRLSLIRRPHQLSLEALGTLGYAHNDSTGEVEKTAANLIGRGRYDLFMSRMDAMFIAVAPRRDTFAGLNIRLQNQIGYLRNLYFPQDEHRLWTELGYDLTYDDFAEITQTTVETNPMGLPAPGPNQTITRTTSITSDPGHEFVHSGRVFVGYTNTLHPLAALNLGAETLLDVQDKKNVRVNGTVELNSTLNARFKLGIQFRVFFDNVPVEGVEKKYDTITAVQLIYTYDSLAGIASAPACPPCDCTADVAAARAACTTAEPLVEPAPAPAPTEPGAPVPPEAAAPAPAAAPAAPATP